MDAGQERLHCNDNYSVTLDAQMTLTNAEKQARYRERHLGIDGEKTRVQLFLSVEAKAQLERVTRHNGYTVTALIEGLTAQADQNIAHRLTGTRADGLRLEDFHRVQHLGSQMIEPCKRQVIDITRLGALRLSTLS
jgi:hypothetical protein